MRMRVVAYCMCWGSNAFRDMYCNHHVKNEDVEKVEKTERAMTVHVPRDAKAPISDRGYVHVHVPVHVHKLVSHLSASFHTASPHIKPSLPVQIRRNLHNIRIYPSHYVPGAPSLDATSEPLRSHSCALRIPASPRQRSRHPFAIDNPRRLFRSHRPDWSPRLGRMSLVR